MGNNNKRLISSSMWTSRKIASLPTWARAEFSWIYPITNSYGCFEADPHIIYCQAYACSRPDFTEERVSELLDAFNEVGLLFRWTDEHGRVCGHWVGSAKSGLLPPPSERPKADAEFPQPPRDQLLAYERRQLVGKAYEEPTTCLRQADEGTDIPLLHPSYEEPTKVVGNASYGLDRFGKDRNGEHSATEVAPPVTPHSPAPSKKGSRIPPNFEVTAEHREFARENGLPDPDSQVEQFRDYWIAQPGSKGVKLDWDATFRNWLRRAPEFTKNAPAEIIKPASTGALERMKEAQRAAGVGPYAVRDAQQMKQRRVLGHGND